MDAYQYAMMKETIERIQKKTDEWRNEEEKGVDISCDAMYDIETILDEAGFDE